MSKKSILFLSSDKDGIGLYKRLLKEKYIVVLFSAFAHTPQDLIERIKSLSEEDKKRTIILITDIQENDEEMRMGIINLIHHGEFCLVICSKNGGVIHPALKTRLTCISNQNIVVKMIDHYHKHSIEE